LIVAEGGEVTGDVKRLEPGEELTLPTADSAVPATPANLATATRPALSPSSERWSN